MQTVTTEEANGRENVPEATPSELIQDQKQHETDRKLIVFPAQKNGSRTAHVVNLASLERCATSSRARYLPTPTSRSHVRTEPELIQVGWCHDSEFPDGTHAPEFLRGHDGTIKKIDANEEAHQSAATDVLRYEVY